MKNKDEELGPMVRTVIEASAILMGWEKRQPKDPEKPNAFKENFWAMFRTLFGVYSIRYALLPLGILRGNGRIRMDNGYFVYGFRQIHVFGFRIVRWTTETKWVVDKPKFEVADVPTLGREAEAELLDGIQEEIAQETDRQVIGDLEAAAAAADEMVRAGEEVDQEALEEAAQEVDRLNGVADHFSGKVRSEPIEIDHMSCDHMTAAEFAMNLAAHDEFNDDDGHFEAATATHILPGVIRRTSEWPLDPLPTHVVWFGK